MYSTIFWINMQVTEEVERRVWSWVSEAGSHKSWKFVKL